MSEIKVKNENQEIIELGNLIAAIDEAGFIINTQKDFIDFLLGNKESFGSADTFGFGFRADHWLKQWEESKVSKN